MHFLLVSVYHTLFFLKLIVCNQTTLQLTVSEGKYTLQVWASCESVMENSCPFLWDVQTAVSHIVFQLPQQIEYMWHTTYRTFIPQYA